MSNRGGKRENAGRPAGQGKYGESTVTMRIPQSQTATIKSFLEAWQRKRAKAAGENAITEIEVDEFFTPAIREQPTLLPFSLPKSRQGFPVRRMIMSRSAWISANL
jgi:DNA polymerase V